MHAQHRREVNRWEKLPSKATLKWWAKISVREQSDIFIARQMQPGFEAYRNEMGSRRWAAFPWPSSSSVRQSLLCWSSKCSSLLAWLIRIIMVTKMIKMAPVDKAGKVILFVVSCCVGEKSFYIQPWSHWVTPALGWLELTTANYWEKNDSLKNNNCLTSNGWLTVK